MLIFALEFINLFVSPSNAGYEAFGSSKHMFERILRSTPLNEAFGGWLKTDGYTQLVRQRLLSEVQREDSADDCVVGELQN